MPRLNVGDKLGPHEILALIGAGGMGEVYRAHDPRLRRDVAIKVSAEKFSDRFEREARAIASLNHTNVCHLYDVGPNYLVMELVEGEPLTGPLRFDEALPLVRQLIDGIEAAHERNIVHRDLKPANIKLTPEGVVKILDFGLAKDGGGREGADPENSPTLTMGTTQAGMILGTAAYMAPEQARGKTADKRSDIWSFGVVVYELLTGKKPFEGESVVETLGAVINRDPDWTAVPSRAQRLLKWCLEKDRKQRLQSIGDARRILEEIPEAAPAPARSGSLLLWAPLAFAIAALAVLAFIHFREQPPLAELTRFQIPLPPNEAFPSGLVPQAISPDGRKLAFEMIGADGKQHLWIRSFDSLEAHTLPGVDPSASPAPFFWSPDSRFLAFASSDQKLKKVAVAGGPPQTLCDASIAMVGGDWSPDGVILFVDANRGVMRVSEAGGMPRLLTSVDRARHEVGHVFPKFLPDGRHFLYIRDSTESGSGGIYVGSIDAKPAEQSTKPLLVNDSYPEAYVPSGASGSGWLLFNREGSVLAQPFDPGKLALSGDPVPVAEQLGQGAAGVFSVSMNGLLVFTAGNQGAGSAQLTWFDRDGKALGTVGEPGNYYPLAALSQDTKQAAVVRIDPQARRKSNLWLVDFTRSGAFTKFTFDSSQDAYPVFSPDGSRIVFTSSRDGPSNLYQKLTSGKTDEEPLLKTDESKYPWSWSSDGRFLLYDTRSQKTNLDVWILPMQGAQRTPMLFQGTEFNELEPQFSPDGHWIAYTSDQSGRNEIYVREFSLGPDGKPDPTAKHQISTDGGGDPHWRDDGKELIYVSPDRKAILSAEIATTPDFRSSPAKALFTAPGIPGIPPNVTGDGKRILLALPVTQNNGLQQFTVVQNWPQMLRK
jgi:eukaryotic-like serine/threonine-protein kinase